VPIVCWRGCCHDLAWPSLAYTWIGRPGWEHAVKQNIVVATHHKTGTVWMATVFKAIARRLDANYVDFWSHYGRLDRVLKTPFILLNHNSIFSQHAKELRRKDVRMRRREPNWATRQLAILRPVIRPSQLSSCRTSIPL